MGENVGLEGQMLPQISRDLLHLVASVAEEQGFVSGPGSQGGGQVG